MVDGRMNKKLGKHRSVDSALKQKINWLEKQKSIKKIVLGASRNCRHAYSPGHIKLQRFIDGGMKVNLYSGNGVTTGYIYCEEENKKIVSDLLDS
jgi:hypothetical protein